MNLSLKATRFVIEALEHYRQYHDQQLKRNGLSEDEISDLVNDQLYLDAIKHELEEYRDTLSQQCQAVKDDG